MNPLRKAKLLALLRGGSFDRKAGSGQYLRRALSVRSMAGRIQESSQGRLQNRGRTYLPSPHTFGSAVREFARPGHRRAFCQHTWYAKAADRILFGIYQRRSKLGIL